MADEFQDTSGACAALVAEPVNGPGQHLFTGGGDWQSINRFAGAEMTVMTTFHDRFRAGHTLRLQQTLPAAPATVGGEDLRLRAQPPHPSRAHPMTSGVELVGDEAVAELGVVAVHCECGIGEVGIGQIATADRTGVPGVEGLAGEAQHLAHNHPAPSLSGSRRTRGALRTGSARAVGR